MLSGSERELIDNRHVVTTPDQQKFTPVELRVSLEGFRRETAAQLSILAGLEIVPNMCVIIWVASARD